MTDHKRNRKTVMFTIYGSQRKYLAGLKGPCGEVKAEYRQGETRPGACAFVRVYRWGILVFLGNARLMNSDLKSGILVSLKGVLSKECTGEYLLTRAVGKVISRTCICL